MHRGIRRLGAGEKKTARLTAYLDTVDCDYTLSDPTTEQIPEVPVLLEDNAVARSMNCITEQYSLPAYDGVDPNPVMAPFFILFFGMMMADIGYGLLMLLGSWLFLKKKRPDDRSFMEMIFWCGVTTVVFGAMTGSFFGDFLPQLFKFFDPESTFALPALFSPLDDTMAIMVELADPGRLAGVHRHDRQRGGKMQKGLLYGCPVRRDHLVDHSGGHGSCGAWHRQCIRRAGGADRGRSYAGIRRGPGQKRASAR